jgi:hypothetical protein
VVVLAALVAGSLVALRDPSSRRSPARPAGNAMPRRIVAVTDRHQPVVLDARTGRILATYETHSVALGTQIAVAPDGRSLYFVDGVGNQGCQDHSILRFGLVPRVPGRVVAESASEPAVSPDGRWLAFYRCLPDDARPRQLVVRDLQLGGDRALSPPTGAFFGDRLLFDTDSRHVIFALSGAEPRPANQLGLHRLDLIGDEAMPGQPFDIDPSVFLGAVDADVRYLVRSPHVEYGPDRRVGDVIGTVGPGISATARRRSEAFDGWFGLPSSVTSGSVDRAGRHVLAVSQSTLYRSSRTDARPTKLRAGIVAAAWVPTARPHATPSLAVVRSNGLVQVFLAPASEVVRDVIGLPDVSQIAAVPNGDGLVAGVDTSSPCHHADDPHVERIELGNGAATRIATGRFPVVSISGLVAYEVRCDGVTLGTTDLVTGASTRSSPIGDVSSEASSRVQLVRPVAFSPDGTQLLYLLLVRGHGEQWYVGNVRSRGFVDHVRRLRFDAEPAALTFVDDGHIAVAFTRGSDTVVRRIRLPRAPGGRFGIGPVTTRIRGAVTRLSSDPSGRWFSAILRGGMLVVWGPDVRPFQVVGDADAAAWLTTPAGG